MRLGKTVQAAWFTMALLSVSGISELGTTLALRFATVRRGAKSNGVFLKTVQFYASCHVMEPFITDRVRSAYIR